MWETDGLITSWILATAVLAGACCGLSMLIERAVGIGLPWTLRVPLGLAVMIVLAQFGTLTAATAPLTLPAVLVLAAVGWVVGLAGRGGPGGREGLGRSGHEGGSTDRGGLVAGAVVFGLYALPFFVHGQATWAGYIKLDDTATFMAMADWAFEHGRSAPEVALGTFTVTIQDNLGAGYPIGSLVGAALMGWLPGQDIAWTIQPSMAFGAACLAMALFELGRPILRGSSAAIVAVVASLSALLLGYYLWGGVKELVAAPLIALGPALVARYLAGGGGEGARRALGLGLPLGIVAAALAGAVGAGAGIWIAPIYLLLVVGLWRRPGRDAAIRIGAAAAACGLLLALPAVFTPAGFFNPLQSGLTADTELGNLAEPVSLLQGAGLWPALDFRQDPGAPALVYALIAVICLAAAWLVLWAARREALAALVLGGLLAALATVVVASPWVGAKALAVYSPILLFAGLAGLVHAADRAGRGARQLALSALAAGVAVVALWGAADAYAGISFAPRPHYEELARIDERFAGESPALATEVSISGPRHFLRHIDANAAGGRRAFQVLTRAHEPHPHGVYLDISEIRPDQLRDFRLLVVRRSPVASRPPSEFELAWRGRYYDVWRQLPDDGVQLVQDLHIGGPEDRGGVALCSQIRGIAQMAGPTGVLRAAPAGAPPVLLDPDRADVWPVGWQVLDGRAFSPLGPGSMELLVQAPPGAYRLWVGGEVYGKLAIEIDGEQAVELRGVVNNGGAFEPVGEVELEGREHLVAIEYSGRDLHPGSGFQGTWSPFPIGPVMLEPLADEADPKALVTVPTAEWRSLCGKRWDWVEARIR